VGALRAPDNNETILKIDLATSEPLRFEHHNHQDEYLIGSVLIADSVKQVEVAHSDPTGKIPTQTLHVRGDAHNARSIHGPEGKHTV